MAQTSEHYAQISRGSWKYIENHNKTTQHKTKQRNEGKHHFIGGIVLKKENFHQKTLD